MKVTDTPPAVAYPGRDGAHSAAACERLFPHGADLRPLPSFLAVVEATTGGEVDFGVLPIESSLAGSVAETHDLLHEYPLSIVAETALRIRHCLVALEDTPLEEITTIRSHPVALDQCPALVAANALGDGDRRCDDRGRRTAGGGERRLDAGRDRERAGRTAARADGARGRRRRPSRGIHTLRVALHLHPHRPRGRGMAHRVHVRDRPFAGVLYRAIEPFGRLRIDLHQLVSRPIPRTPWRYRFDAVLAGHPLDPIVNEALREMAERTLRLQVFGSDPARRDVEEE